MLLQSKEGFSLSLGGLERLEAGGLGLCRASGAGSTSDGLSLGRRREIGVLDGANLLAGAVLRGAHELLRLLSVFTGVLTDGLGSLTSVLCGEILDLGCLLVDGVAGVAKVLIDELLVGDVDERSEEDKAIADQGKSPKGHEPHEVVGDEGRDKSTNGDPDVFDEKNTLELDDEEVDQLLDVVESALEGFLGESPVLARPHLSGQTITQNGLSGELSSGSDTHDDVQALEDVADDVQVSRGEDEEDRCCKGNTRGSWASPAQKAVEQRMILSQRLSSRSWLIRDLTSIGEILEFGRCLGRLRLDLLTDGSIYGRLLNILGDRVVGDGIHGGLSSACNGVLCIL